MEEDPRLTLNHHYTLESNTSTIDEINEEQCLCNACQIQKPWLNSLINVSIEIYENTYREIKY